MCSVSVHMVLNGCQLMYSVKHTVLYKVTLKAHRSYMSQVWWQCSCHVSRLREWGLGPTWGGSRGTGYLAGWHPPTSYPFCTNIKHCIVRSRGDKYRETLSTQIGSILTDCNCRGEGCSDWSWLPLIVYCLCMNMTVDCIYVWTWL